MNFSCIFYRFEFIKVMNETGEFADNTTIRGTKSGNLGEFIDKQTKSSFYPLRIFVNSAGNIVLRHTHEAYTAVINDNPTSDHYLMSSFTKNTTEANSNNFYEFKNITAKLDLNKKEKLVQQSPDFN